MLLSNFVSGKMCRKLNTAQSSHKSVNRWGFSYSGHSPRDKRVPVAILSGSRMSKGN